MTRPFIFSTFQPPQVQPTRTREDDTDTGKFASVFGKEEFDPFVVETPHIPQPDEK